MKGFFKASFALFLIGLLGAFATSQFKNGSDQLFAYLMFAAAAGFFGMILSGIVKVFRS